MDICRQLLGIMTHHCTHTCASLLDIIAVSVVQDMLLRSMCLACSVQADMQLLFAIHQHRMITELTDTLHCCQVYATCCKVFFATSRGRYHQKIRCLLIKPKPAWLDR